MKKYSLSQTASKKIYPGRLLLPGCAVAAGLLTVSPVVAAESAPQTAAVKSSGAVLSLVLGKTANLPLPAGASFTVEEGANLAVVTNNEGTLSIKALAAGTVRIRVDAPNRKAQFTNLRLMDAVSAYVERRVQAQVVDPAVPTAPATTTAPPPLPSLVPVTPAPDPLEAAPLAPVPAPAPAEALPVPPVEASGGRVVTPPAPPSLPAITRVQSGTGTAPSISPSLPPPAVTNPPRVGYRTTPSLPRNVNARNARSSVPVGQGLARLLSFPRNILAVFYSDPAVMDARAINARTIAVTGVAPGPYTLAVFTQRYPGDAVGQANIYRVEVTPRAGTTQPVETRSPQEVQASIESALNDPRIRVSVIQTPDGSLAARLTGGLRSQAEVQGAVDTAAFFVPRVLTSLYADPNAQTLDQAQAAAGFSRELSDEDLQNNLRRITGNDTLELIALPNSYILKGEAGSAEEAQRILQIIPSLNREVTPYLVIRGVDNSQNPVYGQTIPVLKGEDRQLTDRLQTVTGLRTVYAIRASANGIAVYGTVRGRAEYESVRRMSQTLAQLSTPPAIVGTSQGGSNVNPTGTELRLDAYAPEGGYKYPLGVQMFVRILDPAQATIRQVTISTDIVEISRTSLKELGVQFGSATLLSEQVTPTSTAVVVDNNGNPVTTVTPGSVTRTIDPAFKEGTLLGGNGLIGTGGFGNIDPFRARLNALYAKGNARILSRPNVTTMEGMPAQILVGGQRPVPRAIAGGNGAIGQDVEFRKFGIIMGIRPTVTAENSIILQIRADITQIDTSTQISLNGTLVPGETTRSIDTTLTIRPGDILVLGGLITNERRTATSKIPVLGDLPIIGSLFQSRRFENNQSELAIFMSPQITAVETGLEGMEKVFRAPSWPILPDPTPNNDFGGAPGAPGGGGR